MSDWRRDIEDAVQAFSSVAAMAGIPLSAGALTIEYLDAPHRPPSRLPPGMMAVYGFWGDGCWLKIGMAGAKSGARYCSQHYLPGSALSTLAASLVGDPRMASVVGFSPTAAGEWIKHSAHRVNILMPSWQPRELLALLEAFLHLRLRPRYERGALR